MMKTPLPRPNGRLQIVTPHGSADSLLITQYSTVANPLLILASNAQAGYRLREEITFFQPHKKTVLLPDWETLPYDLLSPHYELISERLKSLWQIRTGEAEIIIVPVQTAMGRMPPTEYLTAYSFFLKKGQKLDATQLRADLAFAGYRHVMQVYVPGEFSIRGGLIDLFPMGSHIPYRIDLFDNEIESIRIFDVDTQRSTEWVSEIRLLPAHEFPLDEGGRTQFRQRFREEFEGDPSRCHLYKDISAGLTPPGIEYYFPLFFDHTATLFDYLPSASVVILQSEVRQTANQFWLEVQERYKLSLGDKDRPVLPPAYLFLSYDLLFGLLKQHRRIEFTEEEATYTLALPDLAVDRRADNPLTKLQHFLAHHPGRVLICAESLGRRETMAQYFAEYGLKLAAAESWIDFETQVERVLLMVAPILNGFLRQHDQLAIITEANLYPSTVKSHSKSRKKSSNTDALLRDLSELKPGDPVVHEAHGIGRYQGLISMDLGDGLTELLVLQYAGNDKLYIPVSQLYMVSRYCGGAMEGAPLHKLGNTTAWEKTKRRAAEQVRDTAAELLNLYAHRAARQGHAFDWSQHDYEAFSEDFGFEETPDQQAAIEAVLADMRIGKPMDRLICGDVGFGKTEVALRATFAAVLGNRQVAVLVPTTLLAEQHFQTFSDRFASWPVKIVELSRFRSKKENSIASTGLADGSVDVVIGTHKLIQPDIQFKRLGLVIIDEEHRFGVHQKEQLKALRADVDVLTLTATPIPRTLAMSLEGLRDFSIIATAPSKRLAVKTFIARLSDGIIREAVLREVKRGGQVFFLHNEVETIQSRREKLVALLPEVRIGVAHGQMRERELEQVMRDFCQQRFHLLLCTTIIETGIDIPNANTLLVNRADQFGLAQLHQIRGRIGRSHHQAYCYLLVPELESLSPDARKRLEAIQAMEELGSGFYLAMHDLEIRGAGEVLGESQSGEMQEIGFTLYSQMLNEAVKALQTGREPDFLQMLGMNTEINLHAPALLPMDYCPDVNERLLLYKRLADCEAGEDIDAMTEELIDRFGPLPDATRVLLNGHRLRLLAKPLGIKKIDVDDKKIIITFALSTPIEPSTVLNLVQKRKNYRLLGADRLQIEGNWPETALRVVRVKEIMAELQQS